MLSHKITKTTWPILALVFLGCRGMAQAGEAVKLQPFSAQTNYMSVRGYLRYRSYRTRKQWLPRPYFADLATARFLASGSRISADLGNYGQIGDVDAQAAGAIADMATFIELFPGYREYRVGWSYTFSVGEGAIQDDMDFSVIYDSQSRRLTAQSWTSSVYRLTDQGVFEAVTVK